ncbi:MAG: antibiotic biosynthesis monooxygenase [Thaumarchaeota archaeon]|nr:antibiotic biosynthesis monooxygenase [Nitrososphaerota archaeon]
MISKSGNVTTAISHFKIDSEYQKKQVDLLREFIDDTLSRQPGFVSSTIHKSSKGSNIINYSQWADLKGHNVTINHIASPEPRSVLSFATHELDSHGAINKDIYLIFIFQAMVIGALGIGMGDSLGLVYTVIAKEIHLTYNGSIPLDVQFNLWELLMDDLMIFVVAIFVSLNPTKKALKIRTIDVLDSFIDEKRHLGIDTPKR